jgi:prevent-host-death family protein
MTRPIRRPRLDEDVVPFTEYRRTLNDCFERTARTHRPIVITQNGRSTSVMMSVADFERTWDEIEAWREKAEITKAVEISRQQFAEGKFRSEEEVFNRLTNNGRVQGIYLENGQLYINGNYIKARTIKTVDLETTGVITSLGDLINDNGWIQDTRDTRIRLQSGAERFERKVGNSWKTVGSLCSVPGIGVPDEFYIGSEGYLEIYAKEKLFTTNSSHSGTGLSKDIIIPYVYHNIDTNRETRAYLRMRFINGMLVYIQPRYSGSGDTPIITDY